MDRRLALFDLDHTLIPLDSDQAWAQFMIRLGVDGSVAHAAAIDEYYLRYVAGERDMDGYLELSLAPLARFSRAQLRDWHRQFMEAVISPAILPAARALLAEHQQAGDLCCIVTATNRFVTEPIAAALGVAHLLAIDLRTENDDPDGPYTGEIHGVPTFREGKVIRTEAWLASLGHRLSDFSRSYFYSDSINDLPLLERVTDPIASNPDARLREVALQRQWPIIELFP
ncbi:phosphoserine phosphatase [Robbsia andropogonis]|uniref:Phosphoserine phosphatase n=1 Tax=Robbsia andropogonis TaxID=28092 RepID=A0A0F5K551_9BURK|nr:HAD family hydrolase [Robbsia andropogonis]KKB65050.1 phosphoserine phosphatase [Robbsia andropogonis]MCP1119090.1 HAD-IB family hydrolase [Robbsia andropogonis]MCP1129059.1 HAD-IB family hydrolase [Robbsia andropogonis]